MHFLNNFVKVETVLYEDLGLRGLQAVGPDGRSFRWPLACAGKCSGRFLLEKEKDSRLEEEKAGIGRGRLTV